MFSCSPAVPDGEFERQFEGGDKELGVVVDLLEIAAHPGLQVYGGVARGEARRQVHGGVMQKARGAKRVGRADLRACCRSPVQVGVTQDGTRRARV